MAYDDVLEGQWKQLRGHVKNWWGKLTDDDLDRIEGKRDVLLGKLQERYGYTRTQAEEEFDRHMREYNTQYGRSSSGYGTQPPPRP